MLIPLMPYATCVTLGHGRVPVSIDRDCRDERAGGTRRHRRHAADRPAGHRRGRDRHRGVRRRRFWGGGSQCVGAIKFGVERLGLE
jgi:hypothetical protein